MKRLYDRLLDNLEVDHPTENFRKTYFPVTIADHIFQIAYIGYIQTRLLGQTTNDTMILINRGLEELTKLVDVFMAPDPTIEQFIDLRYVMGVIASTSLANYIWKGELGVSTSRSLSVVRTHLEAAVDSRISGESLFVPVYHQRLCRLRDAPFFWMGTQRRIREITEEIKQLPENYFIS